MRRNPGPAPKPLWDRSLQDNPVPTGMLVPPLPTLTPGSYFIPDISHELQIYLLTVYCLTTAEMIFLQNKNKKPHFSKFFNDSQCNPSSCDIDSLPLPPRFFLLCQFLFIHSCPFFPPKHVSAPLLQATHNYCPFI